MKVLEVSFEKGRKKPEEDKPTPPKPPGPDHG
jgi:hypothetical protein